MGALEFLSEAQIPRIDIKEFRRPLVVGSVNAFCTGKIIFDSVDAVYAEESNFEAALTRVPGIDAVYILSASGAKHAVGIAERVKNMGLPVFLITNNPEAPARVHVASERVLVFPRFREPYTYNTSTYMSMMLGTSEESPKDILSFIESQVLPIIPTTLGSYQSFILTIRPEFAPERNMFETKFDELFGSLRFGRSFTSEEVKHAKTVILSDTEYFINFGIDDTRYAQDRAQISIPLPEHCGPVAMLAIAYFVIGHIQKQNQPFFKDNVAGYVQRGSRIFNEATPIIVE
jgi:hypothetical protein